MSRPTITEPCTVHPHTRGEHSAPTTSCGFLVGSSPHAWGTLGRFLRLLELLRFIPTCVGNTVGQEAVLGRLAVHPHMRGEHQVLITMDMAVNGSSPHAWGTPMGGH